VLHVPDLSLLYCTGAGQLSAAAVNMAVTVLTVDGLHPSLNISHTHLHHHLLVYHTRSAPVCCAQQPCLLSGDLNLNAWW
jgi:hypothetical protein